MLLNDSQRQIIESWELDGARIEVSDSANRITFSVLERETVFRAGYKLAGLLDKSEGNSFRAYAYEDRSLQAFLKEADLVGCGRIWDARIGMTGGFAVGILIEGGVYEMKADLRNNYEIKTEEKGVGVLLPSFVEVLRLLKVS